MNDAVQERLGFIPLPMIPLIEMAVGNASGRADLARRNQMKMDGDLVLEFVAGRREPVPNHSVSVFSDSFQMPRCR